MWLRAAHREAFDRPTAVFAYAADSATVSGPYRDETPDLETLPTLVPGERLAVTVGIENVDDRTGTYDATLLVDGGIVDSGDGRLDTGERATETLAWTPEAPGRHEVVSGRGARDGPRRAPRRGDRDRLRGRPRDRRAGR